MTSNWAFTWLTHCFLASTVLLSLCALGISLLRQPADRVRLIQGGFAATLVTMVLFAIPQFSLLSLGILGSTDNARPIANIGLSSTFESPPATVLPEHPALVEPASPASAAAPVPPPLQGAGTPAETPSRALVADDVTALTKRAICIVYLLGMALFLIRWVLARMALARLLRGTHGVPGEVHAELARIAGSAAQKIRLLASGTLSGPVTWGTRRPVIVIPSAVLCDTDPARLRYYLAHEWGHVSRRDFATWQFANLLQVVLYYQPLFWWVRNRLAVDMDQLADADASDQGGSTTDYADFLVEVARQRMAPHPQLSLGINDRKSSIYQRIVFLLNAASRPRPTCPRGRSVLISFTALLLAATISVVRLDAQPAAAPSSSQKDKPVAASTESQPPLVSQSSSVAADGAITYQGIVTDAVSGKPIGGVKVGVLHKDSRDWTLIETTQHETDAEGRYSFVIPPEQAAIDSLYIEVEANHPNFCPMSRSGYSHAMIRKNLTLGEEPFYAAIRLWPGEPITGIVVSPEGEPQAEVKVSMYCVSALVKERFRGTWGETKTDANGAFRIVLATPGDGVLWIKPEHYSPQAHRIAERRGDWGRITLQKGTDVAGHVLDVQGTPVVGVKVEARRKGDGEKADEFLNANAVANNIGREAITGPSGEFALASLPAGDYTLSVEPSPSHSDSYDRLPLQQVFLRKQVSIVDGKPLEPFEIRAVPHVVIHGQYLDSAGKPRRGSEVSLFGKVDGGFFYARSSQPGDDGKFEIRAPHGIEDVELDLITNEHSSLRWRMAQDQPLHRGRRVKVGTLEDDVSGFEVVRYVAPVVLIKAVDEAGTIVEEIKPILKYTRSQDDGEQLTVYTTGNHVNFNKQDDHRWRSEQLVPDEPISVTVEKAGYTATEQELDLPEGEKREVTLVLKKAPDDDKPDKKQVDEK